MCDLSSGLQMSSRSLNVNQVTQLLPVFCEINENLGIFAELHFMAPLFAWRLYNSSKAKPHKPHKPPHLSATNVCSLKGDKACIPNPGLSDCWSTNASEWRLGGARSFRLGGIHPACDSFCLLCWKWDTISSCCLSIKKHVTTRWHLVIPTCCLPHTWTLLPDQVAPHAQGLTELQLQHPIAGQCCLRRQVQMFQKHESLSGSHL